MTVSQRTIRNSLNPDDVAESVDDSVQKSQRGNNDIVNRILHLQKPVREVNRILRANVFEFLHKSGVFGLATCLSRKDETKMAASSCLIALIKPRKADVDSPDANSEDRTNLYERYIAHSRTDPMLPIIGQTVEALREC